MEMDSRKKPVKNVIFSYLLLSNIGCEIILRGSIAFLIRALPEYDLRFIVSSYHPSHDKKLISDLSNVTVIPVLTWKRYLRGLLQKTGLFLKYWSPRFSTRYFRNADLFVSVGGDIYTMFGNALPIDWLGYETYATKHNIPSIMFGANMERFEILSETDKDLLRKHLKNFRLIAVRDQDTEVYLASFGVAGNVHTFPDPIFSLRPQTVFERNKIKTIGINFTPILIRNFGESVIDKYAKLVCSLIDKGYAIRLIPHVHSIDGTASIDDPTAIRLLFARLPEGCKEKVHLFTGKMSFYEIADELQHIDLFVGARMHGCLNSLTLGKAVCFLGYSKKVHTMVDTLKSKTPFKQMAQSFLAIPADNLTIVELEKLISAHNQWAEENNEAVIVNTEAYLASLPIWSKVPVVFNSAGN